MTSKSVPTAAAKYTLSTMSKSEAARTAADLDYPRNGFKECECMNQYELGVCVVERIRNHF
jgi:hypothetical protein